jgi:hypothetical protein
MDENARWAALHPLNARPDMRRPKAKAATSFERDRRRGLITCAWLSAALAAAIIAGGTVTKGNSSSDGDMAYMDPAGSLQAGAVLFVPVEGNVCRKRSIDNESWRIKDDGYVVCDEAVTWNSGAANQKYFVTVRVDAIRAGFKAVSQGKSP